MRCPCGFHSTRVKHSGRRRAPPGSTTRPCQELADDPRVYTKRRLSPLSSVDAETRNPNGTIGQRRGISGESGAGAGNDRDWRAARRLRAARHEPRIMRLSARHPLVPRGEINKPDAETRRGKEPACLIRARWIEAVLASALAPTRASHYFPPERQVTHAATDRADKHRDRRDFAFSGRVRPRAAPARPRP